MGRFSRFLDRVPKQVRLILNRLGQRGKIREAQEFYRKTGQLLLNLAELVRAVRRDDDPLQGLNRKPR